MQGGSQGTFRDRIGVNRRNSVFLILVFLVFVLLLGYVIGYAWIGDPVGALFGLALALVVGTIAGLLSYFAGDKMVLAASRATEITHEDAPRLFNVVEEMAIAGGLPMPKVYIIQDTAPNAFATGRDPEHASVAVTSGPPDKPDRDESQGLHHPGHRPQRLRPGPRPRARRRRRHERPARQARPGRAAGRHRPRDGPCWQLRHPLRHACGHPRRHDRPDLGLLPARALVRRRPGRE